MKSIRVIKGQQQETQLKHLQQIELKHVLHSHSIIWRLRFLDFESLASFKPNLFHSFVSGWQFKICKSIIIAYQCMLRCNWQYFAEKED